MYKQTPRAQPDQDPEQGAQEVEEDEEEQVVPAAKLPLVVLRVVLARTEVPEEQEATV